MKEIVFMKTDKCVSVKFPVDDAKQVESIINNKRDLEHLKFMYDKCRLNPRIVSTQRAKHILKSFAMIRGDIKNTQQLEEIMTRDWQKLFRLSKKNPVISAYIVSMFVQYKGFIRANVGKPYMVVRESADIKVLPPEFSMYEMFDDHVVYSLIDENSTAKIYRILYCKQPEGREIS